MPTPADWFLDSSQMAPYRTPAATRHNLVAPIWDGKAYFDALAVDMSTANDATSILLAGWRFSAKQKLTPKSSSATVLDSLATARGNGAHIRVMAYGSFFAATLPIQVPGLPSRDNDDFVKLLRKARVEAFLDTRLAPMGSQHQKAVIVKRTGGGNTTAYVGGLDLCYDRYDSPLHNSPPERQREPDVTVPLPPPLPWLTVSASQPGWHDVQAAVRGPAVSQLWQALAQRWNDPAIARAGEANPAPIDASEEPAPLNTPYTFAVQVLRTVPCNNVFYFMPKGEQTVRSAYEKAINAAAHFIYIEDQYLWPSPVTAALANAVKRGVEVIAVVARDYDIPGLSTVHKKMRAANVAEIYKWNPSRRRVFHKESLPRMSKSTSIRS